MFYFISDSGLGIHVSSDLPPLIPMLSSFLISSPLFRVFPQEEGGNKGVISRRTRTIYKVRSTTLFSLRPFAPQVFSQVLPFHSLNLADAEPCLLRALDSFCSSLPRISVGASQPSALSIHPSSVLLPSLPFSTRLVCHVFCLAPFLVMCLAHLLLPFDAPPSPSLRSFRAMSFPPLSDRTHGRHARTDGGEKRVAHISVAARGSGPKDERAGKMEGKRPWGDRGGEGAVGTNKVSTKTNMSGVGGQDT